MSIAKEMRATRARMVEEARGFLALGTAEGEAKFDAAMQEVDALAARIEKAERADALVAELAEARAVKAEVRGVSVAQVEDEAAREQKRIVAYVTGNFSALSDEDQRIVRNRIQAAGSTGTNSAGGYTVAPGFMRDLLIAQKAFGGMRAAARTITTDTGVDLAWPTMDDTSNVASIVGENTAGSAGTDLVFGSKTLKAWTYRSGYLLLSLELLQDSAFDFDALVRDALAQRFARGQNAHFTTGNGTTAPEGIVTNITAGKTGATGQTTSVTYGDLVDLIHSVDPAYRPGAQFMFADSTLKAIKRLVDGQGRPLWQPSLTSGEPDSILGFGYTVNQDVPVMAANAKSIIFGNFQDYIIRDVMGLRIVRLNERWAENAQVGFVAFQRTDGRPVSAAAPFRAYVNSAT